MDKPRVLVVEDEEAIRMGICDVLAFHGCEAEGVGDGPSGLSRALVGNFSLVILDVMLPGLDGFSICKQLRQARPHQAIMMVTARGVEGDILEGFRCGADDYITKPFSVAQLVARIQALLRRVRVQPTQTFLMGPLTIDARRLVVSCGAESVAVTGRDIDVLSYLLESDGRVVSRKELLRVVWGYQRVEAVETRCVDMHIAKLRRKLSSVTGVSVIETVRGSGYRYVGVVL